MKRLVTKAPLIAAAAPASIAGYVAMRSEVDPAPGRVARATEPGPGRAFSSVQRVLSPRARAARDRPRGSAPPGWQS